jgi:hypothetical protein
VPLYPTGDDELGIDATQARQQLRTQIGPTYDTEYRDIRRQAETGLLGDARAATAAAVGEAARETNRELDAAAGVSGAKVSEFNYTGDKISMALLNLHAAYVKSLKHNSPLWPEYQQITATLDEIRNRKQKLYNETNWAGIFGGLLTIGKYIAAPFTGGASLKAVSAIQASGIIPADTKDQQVAKLSTLENQLLQRSIEISNTFPLDIHIDKLNPPRGIISHLTFYNEQSGASFADYRVGTAPWPPSAIAVGRLAGLI